MIIRRKLYSKKDKYESSSGRKARHTLSNIVGVGVGTGIGTGMILKSMANYDADRSLVEGERKVKSLNNLENYLSRERVIDNRAADIFDALSRRNMSLYDKAKSISNLKDAVTLLKDKNSKLYKSEEEAINKARNLAIKPLKKVRNKKFLKGGLISLSLGTASGLGMNELIKKKQDKLGIKRKNKK